MKIWGRKKNGQPYKKDPVISPNDANLKKLIIATQDETNIIADFNSGNISQEDTQRMLLPIEKARIEAANKIKDIRVEKTDKKEG